MKLTMQVP